MAVFARIIATLCAAAAFAAGAQSYRWTDITPAFGGNSDRGHVQVEHVGIDPLNGNRLVIFGGFWPGGQLAAPSYEVMYSDDGGQTWNPPASPAPSGYIDSMFSAVGLPGTVYATQASQLGGGYFGVLPSVGHLFRSDDFGRTWSVAYTIPVGTSIFPFGSDPLDAHGIYASYQEEYRGSAPGQPTEHRNPGTMRTHDDGVSWSAPLAAPGGDEYALYFEGPAPAAPTRLFMGSQDSGTFVSNDSGATWSRADTGSARALTWIHSDPLHANVLYAARKESAGTYVLLRSDDGGGSWRLIFALPGPFPNLAIEPARPNVLWMPYGGINLLRSEDRGESWHSVLYPLQALPPGYSPDGTLVPSTTGSGVVYLIRFDRLYRGDPIPAPDPVVVEYTGEGDRYWLTSLDGEAVSQDYRQQPGDVHRTGLRWGAWRAGDAPSGAVGSCRFWSRPESGLRTRVLVLQGFECEILKQDSTWVLEAENEFYAVPPVNETCGDGLVPIRRFNNLQADLNHRWVADAATAAQMRARGWYDEGLRFCARPLGSNE